MQALLVRINCDDLSELFWKLFALDHEKDPLYVDQRVSMLNQLIVLLSRSEDFEDYTGVVKIIKQIFGEVLLNAREEIIKAVLSERNLDIFESLLKRKVQCLS